MQKDVRSRHVILATGGGSWISPASTTTWRGSSTSTGSPVPRAEHLVAMKVRAMRNDPARLVQDLADVQHLLRLPETDRAEVRGYFEKAGMLDWYDRLIATI